MARNVLYAASEGRRFAGETTLVTVTCATCGMLYAIPQGLYNSAQRYHGDKRDGWKLTCPLGHQWWYVGETEEQRLTRERDWARSHAGSLAHRLDQTEASRVAQKAATTRIRNERDRIQARVSKGVCPCCNRSFKNVRRHMASQHPEWEPES